MDMDSQAKPIPLKDEIAQVSEQRLKDALRLTRWNISATADTLGVSRQTVYSMIARWNIVKP